VEIQQLKYFLQICDDLNYATAADHLYISQQALRKSIKKLEDEIGLQLIYRKGNQLRLTPAGSSVRLHASSVMRDLERMDASIALFKEESGHIELTIVLSNGGYERVADDIIEPYKKANPNVSIRTIEVPDLVGESYILHGMADIGFTFGPHDPAVFDYWTLISEPIYAMINKSNPLAKRKRITVSDLKGQQIGIADERFRIYYQFCSACRRAGFDPNIDFRGGDPYSVHHYSHVTDNITITCGDFYGALAEGDQVVVPIDGEGLLSHFNLIVRKGAEIDGNYLKFIEFAKQQYGIKG
jgi:LysR family transcriptional activator of glutamate synthase operon